VSTVAAAVSAIAAAVAVWQSLTAQREARADSRVRKYERLIELLGLIAAQGTSERGALHEYRGQIASLPQTDAFLNTLLVGKLADTRLIEDAKEELRNAISAALAAPEPWSKRLKRLLRRRT